MGGTGDLKKILLWNENDIMESFTIREATQADRDEVFSIRNDPSDYLAEYYNYFITSRQITSFVLLHKERIVGFSAAFIVDDGQTLVARSSRVRLEYEGKGWFKKLDRYIDEWAKEKHVLLKVMTSSDENKHVSSPSFLSAHKLLTTMKILTYLVTVKDIKLPTRSTTLDDELTAVTERVMSSYIDCQQSGDYLFPSGRVMVDGVPFKLMKANVPLMFGQRGIQTIFSDVKESHKSPKGLLSVGTIQRVKEPAFIYNIELYGTDVTSVEKHIEKHLDVLKTTASDVVCVFVFTSETLSEEIVDESFSRYNVKRERLHNPDTDIQFPTKRLVFEKHL